MRFLKKSVRSWVLNKDNGDKGPSTSLRMTKREEKIVNNANQGLNSCFVYQGTKPFQSLKHWKGLTY